MSEARKTQQHVLQRENGGTAPWVRSMQTYILAHQWDRVEGALAQWLGQEGITFQACRLSHMCFWRRDAHSLLAEVFVSLRLPGADGGCIRIAYCELWVDLCEGMSFSAGECGDLKDRPQREFLPMSEYLVPVMSREEIEKQAEELLLRHCPEHFTQPRGRYAQTLARRMGLQVMWLPLHQRGRTRSILFFRPGRVMIAGSDDGQALLRVVRIPAGTILINTNAVQRDQCQLEILHECIHYEWHWMFFRLQEMQHSDLRGMKRRGGINAREAQSKPLAWMEWQARRGSLALMMPRETILPMVSRLSARLMGSPHHAGRRYDWICRSIAAAQDWPRFRVRARLIQLGHVEAKGALNYVDGAYIEPFAFRRDNGEGACSFVIDRQGVLELYDRDEHFRAMLTEGGWVYADGHVCRSGEAFVRRTDRGLRLTPWANAHVDQCCLRFILRYESDGQAEYALGEMNCDEEYNRRYFEYAGPEQTAGHALAEMAGLLEALPSSFPAALTFLMRRARVTIEQLEERACISARTISRLRTEERGEYALDQVIALCIALHLPPWLSREMLQRAGFALRRTGRHLALQCALDCMFMDEVEAVQCFLQAAGHARLKLNEI